MVSNGDGMKQIIELTRCFGIAGIRLVVVSATRRAGSICRGSVSRSRIHVWITGARSSSVLSLSW